MDCIIREWNHGEVSAVQTAESVTLAPGGDAFNESVILSRLGHRVRVACSLGTDMAGEILSNKLKENHVDTDGVQYHPEIRTPVSPLLVNADGSRSSILTPAHGVDAFCFDPALLEGVKVVSLSSLFRVPFVDPEKILNICQAAKAAGAILCADTKLAKGRHMTLDDIKKCLPYIDYIFPNETEGAYYTGKTDFLEIAEVFFDCGVKNVIVKTGSKGLVAKNAQEQITLPAFPVKAVDSTGAGDNFAAGFISSLLHGKSFREALEFATACAALCVQSVGATTGVQNKEQVAEFLKASRNCLTQ